MKTEIDKRYYSLIALTFFIMMTVLFNMLFIPLILLIVLLYFINISSKMTYVEHAVLALFILPLIIYAIIARIYGASLGIFAVIPAIFAGVIYMIYKRKGGRI